jgi:hypothetical protein
MVEAMVGYGILHEEIARLVISPLTGEGIDAKTLRKCFRAEIDSGAIKANAKVAESLFLQAVGAPAVYDARGRMVRAEQPRVPSCGIWWSKTRMGWKEPPLEHGGMDGKPIAFTFAIFGQQPSKSLNGGGDKLLIEHDEADSA